MKLLTLLLFFCFISFSQDNVVIVDYTFTTKFEILPNPTTVNSRLITNGNSTTYEMDYLGNIDFTDEEPDVNGNAVYALKAKSNPIIYKNSAYIYSVERVIMKPFLVKDTMNIFKWKLHPEKKTLLGYDCQKATVSYRGSNYTAYFTSEIPIQTGPWKFYGLPGLILQVQSNDGTLKIDADKINIQNKNLVIGNPFKESEKKALTWEQYLTEYKKKYNELKSYTSPKGGKIIMPKRLIETLIDTKSNDKSENNYEFKTN